MSFESALQTAVFNRLSGYSGLPTVYDNVPPGAAFPYVSIGEDTHVPWDTDDSTGSESTITIHVWSRYQGKKEAKEILGVIYSALHRYELLDVDGFHTALVRFEYSDVMLDPDGLTRHGVSRYRILVESTA